MKELLSMARITKETGEPLHRIVYVIRSRRIPAVARFGNARVFDREGVEQIRAALAEIREQKTKCMQAKENENGN